METNICYIVKDEDLLKYSNFIKTKEIYRGDEKYDIKESLDHYVTMFVKKPVTIFTVFYYIDNGNHYKYDGVIKTDDLNSLNSTVEIITNFFNGKIKIIFFDNFMRKCKLKRILK